MELESLSYEEKEYLTEIFQLLTPEIYSSKEAKLKFRAYADTWMKEVRKRFEWTDLEIYQYTHTWLTNEEFGEWLVSRKTTLKSTKAEANCDCYYTISCFPEGRLCVSGRCTIVDGCGIFGSTECNGRCE
jgi:hypothetical protein